MFSKHLKIILKEMCDRVDADFDQIDFDKDKWYWEYAWSKDQEKDFAEWLTEYLFDNAQARKEIIAIYWVGKKVCKRSAEEFIWNYGWKEESFFYTPE